MISASEVGFFSLSPTTIRALEESEEDNKEAIPVEEDEKKKSA